MKRVIRKLAVLVPKLSRELVCDGCGQGFSCGASLSGCWCAEIKLSDEARAEMKSKYRDCLCRDCLERISARVATHS